MKISPPLRLSLPEGTRPGKFRDFSFRRRRTLLVPDRFNRNSSTVMALMTPEQSGSWLLERLRERLGVTSLAELHLLDFGCGVRFTQAIVNCDVKIGSYTGVDCYSDMIDFLRSATPRRRYSYHLFDVQHPLYNPSGAPLTPSTPLPVSKRDFDVITMFSVVTHLYPQDSEAIFTIVRRHVAPNGHLFFTCFLDSEVNGFEDRSPERNGGRCHYERAYLMDIVKQSGWNVVDTAPAQPPLIADSFLLRPA
jgi:SAM-dependent methyltransferase